MMTPFDLARQYLSLGIQPIPIPNMSKAPVLQGWPDLRITESQLQDYFNGERQNIGALLGSPSNALVDIDFDDTAAAHIGALLLPKSWAFGRAGQLRHILIKSVGAKSQKFAAPSGACLLEIRSEPLQTVLPGSVHPTGQAIGWITPPDKAKLAELQPDDLLDRVKAIAGAALLVQSWPEKGTRHDLVLACTGALKHAGWTDQRIKTLMTALVEAIPGDKKRTKIKAVTDTLEKATAGEAITGLPKLSELLPDAIVKRLAEWWHLGAGPQLTVGGVPLEAATSSTGSGASSTIWGLEWPELLEFESSDYEGHDRDYPIDALGRVLAPATQALIDQQQVPAALAAQSVLAASASVVQQYFDVVLDGRKIPLALWLALVAAPGERKTSTDNIAFSQLYLRQREAQQRYKVALDGWKAARSDKDVDPGPRPRMPCWLLSDCTTEGLGKTLANHWPALTLTNSDAAAWLAGYSMREGRDSAAAAVMSQLWSGAAHSTARASWDEPILLINRRLSLSLMLQPALAAQLFENNTLAGQGFLSRCLPAFPPSTIGNRPYKQVQDDHRLQAFFDAQDRLLLNPPNMILETGELQLQELGLTPDARQRWIRIHDRYEAELAGAYADIVEVANKAPEQVLRLAGVMAAMENRDQVDPQHIDNAARLVDFYLQEWQAMTTKLVTHRKDITEPQMLLDWMRQRSGETGKDLFNLRDIYRSGPRIVRNQSQKARDLMTELLRRGYVRMLGKDYQLRPDDLD